MSMSTSAAPGTRETPPKNTSANNLPLTHAMQVARSLKCRHASQRMPLRLAPPTHAWLINNTPKAFPAQLRAAHLFAAHPPPSRPHAPTTPARAFPAIFTDALVCQEGHRTPAVDGPVTIVDFALRWGAPSRSRCVQHTYVHPGDKARTELSNPNLANRAPSASVGAVTAKMGLALCSVV